MNKKFAFSTTTIEVTASQENELYNSIIYW
jgi:hypothetical protein